MNNTSDKRLLHAHIVIDVDYYASMDDAGAADVDQLCRGEQAYTQAHLANFLDRITSEDPDILLQTTAVVKELHGDDPAEHSGLRAEYREALDKGTQMTIGSFQRHIQRNFKYPEKGSNQVYLFAVMSSALGLMNGVWLRALEEGTYTEDMKLSILQATMDMTVALNEMATVFGVDMGYLVGRYIQQHDQLQAGVKPPAHYRRFPGTEGPGQFLEDNDAV